MLALRDYGSLVDPFVIGIFIFFDPDAGDDLMGSRCGSLWKKANPSLFPDRSCNGYINIWAQQCDMADDFVQMYCRSLCGYGSVSYFRRLLNNPS
jgi:hypothetical protein